MDRMGSIGLFTDLYELRMCSSYLSRGMTGDATFSLFVRPMAERAWFLADGINALCEALADVRFEPSDLEYLRAQGVDEVTLAWLRDMKAEGEIFAVPDGTVLLPDEPLLEVTAPLPYAQLIETIVINVVSFRTLIATKAARCVLAAEAASVVDFGFRRAHGLVSGVEAAAAAYIGGIDATSNVEAGRRFGIPLVGTMAHAYVQAFPSEIEAFRAFAADHPHDCVLLVDTYDTTTGVRNAIEVAREMAGDGHRLLGIRIDSGDLADTSRTARSMLDQAGLRDVRIIVSGGLDEYDIAALVQAGAPIDVYGVGTSLVTSSDKPSLDISYKIVEYEGRPLRKTSPGKHTLPGRKQIFRTGSEDVLGLRGEAIDGEELLVPAWRSGQALGRSLEDGDLERARARASDQLKDAYGRELSLSSGLRKLIG